MAFKFVTDQIIKGRAYPALSRWQARPYTPAWREFGKHWPWTTPLRIEEYCRQHNFPIELYTLDDYPDGSWYVICLGFFDFEIDYIALLPDLCRTGLTQHRLRLLFMYHEGDNPTRIMHRLDSLCNNHRIDPSQYRLISSNTSADRLQRGICFHDFELWYHQRNLEHAPLSISDQRRKDFLCLNRVHKNWRAAVMADLVSRQVLDNSFWSYCKVDVNTEDDDNPIQVDQIPQLRYRIGRFLNAAPYYCDQMDDEERNNHSMNPDELFCDTFANIVTESQFDVDQSGGVFLTEKTFKPIKHAQIFFIVGAAGSVSELRKLGYRVFDHVLDHSYDEIEDPTLRWLAVRDAIEKSHAQGLASLYAQCHDDLLHNQQLFTQAPWQRLNSLSQRLDRT